MPKFLLFLCISGAAVAATIQFTALPANTEYGTFNGFAVAMVDGSPNQFLICDDYIHTTYMPSGPLTYFESTLTGPNRVQFARFGGGDESIRRYEEAALLLDGLRHAGPGDSLDFTADYQYALWHLFTPSVYMPGSTPKMLLDAVAAEVSGNNPRNLDIYSSLRIFTPSEPFASNQEFLQLLDVPPPGGLNGPGPVGRVPEPSPLLLIGAGVLLLVFAVRRRDPTDGAAKV